VSLPEAPIDPELSLWLQDPRVALTVPSDLAAFREGANGYLARAGRPDIEGVEDIAIEGPSGTLTLRLYRPVPGPEKAIVVFLHGGAFVFGNLDTHDSLCRRLALESGLTLVAVDYRLAPEHPYPAAIEDATAALKWVMARFPGIPVGVAGDSAGAWLAIATALSFAREPRIAGLGLLYPALDPACSSPSQHALGQDYMLTRTFMLWAWSAFSADKIPDLMRADLSALPATTVVTAGFDPLRDEGTAFVERARAAGVKLVRHHYPDMIHGFAGLPQGSRRSREAVARLAEGLAAALA
jgi:acetyl esterase